MSDEAKGFSIIIIALIIVMFFVSDKSDFVDAIEETETVLYESSEEIYAYNNDIQSLLTEIEDFATANFSADDDRRYELYGIAEELGWIIYNMEENTANELYYQYEDLQKLFDD